ncbi:MAG: sugar phosphate isomerase/epimerase family protein [Candidatus Omnitrophota bacterium]
MLSVSLGTLAAEKKQRVIACRDVHLKNVDAPDSWSALKKIGAEGVEVWVEIDRSCPYLFPEKKYSLKSKDAVEMLKKDLEKNGVQIAAFAMPNQFDARLEDELAWTADVVAAAKELNVKAIRIDVVPHKIQGGEFLPFAISLGKKLIEFVKGTDIRFGIENHGSTTNNPAFLDKLFDGVGSNALGLTLDTANFYWFGHPLDNLYGIYAKYASRVFHTHCKSINYPEDKRNAQRPRGWEYEKYNCPIFQGDIDFSKVVSILRSADYQGDFCIEDESLERFPASEREGILKKEIDWMIQLSQV